MLIINHDNCTLVIILKLSIYILNNIIQPCRSSTRTTRNTTQAGEAAEGQEHCSLTPAPFTSQLHRASRRYPVTTAEWIWLILWFKLLNHYEFRFVLSCAVKVRNLNLVVRSRSEQWPTSRAHLKMVIGRWRCRSRNTKFEVTSLKCFKSVQKSIS